MQSRFKQSALLNSLHKRSTPVSIGKYLNPELLNNSPHIKAIFDKLNNGKRLSEHIRKHVPNYGKVKLTKAEMSTIPQELIDRFKLYKGTESSKILKEKAKNLAIGYATLAGTATAGNYAYNKLMEPNFSEKTASILSYLTAPINKVKNLYNTADKAHNITKKLRIGGYVAGTGGSLYLGDKTYRTMNRLAKEVPDELLQPEQV